MKFDPSILLPGDVLLYRPGKLKSGFLGWFFGRLIAVKTWTNISHVEVYVGNDFSLASRDGKGVARYSLRLTEIGYVLRPIKPLTQQELSDGLAWFYSKADGQGYDWLGIMVFSHAVKAGNPYKMFCSEFACRLFRDGFKRPLFSAEWNPDRTPPAMLLATPSLEVVWWDKRPL